MEDFMSSSSSHFLTTREGIISQLIHSQAVCYPFRFLVMMVVNKKGLEEKAIQTKTTELTLTRPNKDDGKKMWQLVKALSPELDMNSAYKYLILSEYFSNCCVVAKKDENVVGFITGFVSPEKRDTVFVWQIGIDKSERGKGLGSKLLMQLVDQQDDKVDYVEASITPSNIASQMLFQRLAKKLNTKCETRLLFKKSQFPQDEEHEEELLYRIGPIDTN